VGHRWWWRRVVAGWRSARRELIKFHFNKNKFVFFGGMAMGWDGQEVLF